LSYKQSDEPQVLEGGVKIKIGEGRTLFYIPNAQLDARKVK